MKEWDIPADAEWRIVPIAVLVRECPLGDSFRRRLVLSENIFHKPIQGLHPVFMLCDLFRCAAGFPDHGAPQIIVAINLPHTFHDIIQRGVIVAVDESLGIEVFRHGRIAPLDGNGLGKKACEELFGNIPWVRGVFARDGEFIRRFHRRACFTPVGLFS